MLDKIRIPLGVVLQFDDVGWDDGRDLRLNGLASRSGLPRYHALEDYQVLDKLGEAMNSKITVALCLGDWDKDNFLRGVVGATHDPYGWDKASEIDVKKFEAYRDVIENSPFVEYTVHALLHGNYDENGKRINESEGFNIWSDEDGVRHKEICSDEYFLEHLDLFFKIYNSWGFKKEVNIYIAPSGMGGITYEHMEHVTKLLYSRGIRYWTNSGFPFDVPVKVINGVACLKQNSEVRRMFNAPWNAYDLDPETFPQFLQEDGTKNSANIGLHWTNLLRFNPKHDFEQVEPWANYFKKQDEVFGYMTAFDFKESVNQTIYHWNAKIEASDDRFIIDLSNVDFDGFEPLERNFCVSLKKGVTPKECIGGSIALHSVHNEFDTYRVEFNGTRVEILI